MSVRERIEIIGGERVRVVSLNTVVIGSGAAGFNAADCLFQNGQEDIAIVTEGVHVGTSRNTGSDKQTYYKLSLSGDDPDSVRGMAEVFFAGGCVDGDHALCEAALSAQCFLKLVELGVPFPRNRYGEFVGYKTDHDPSRRATSIGPYTSRNMTEHLERAVRKKGIAIYDRMLAIRVLADAGKFEGMLCLDLDPKAEERLVLFRCKNAVCATGGPAGMYLDSVYPAGHRGASGMAFEAGVVGKNLTEWQFGMASVRPRWNVSGTYMQCLPKFVSTDADGGDAREFLPDFFDDAGDLLTRVFLKGYQWPFDVRKADGGSSIIDILVYIETRLNGRRVFLDFRENPLGDRFDLSLLGREAREYLERAGAAFGTPIARLLHMNAPAVDFYRARGVDLTTEMLEIALSAQHNNGGLSVDMWWQTNVEGFFAVGEAAATHGVYRPGGSALNAGQVGAARAAQYIAARRTGAPADALPDGLAARIATDAVSMRGAISEKSNVRKLWNDAAARMSRVGGAVRNVDGMREAATAAKALLDDFFGIARIASDAEFAALFRLRDMLISQFVYLSAMVDYAERGGGSRGSALYTDARGTLAHAQLPEIFRFVLDDGSRADRVQEIAYRDGHCAIAERAVRPIPVGGDVFENVWRDFREHGNIY